MPSSGRLPPCLVRRYRAPDGLVNRCRYRADSAAQAARNPDPDREGRGGRRREDHDQAAPVVQLAGGTKSVNRDLETKAKTLAGWKGCAPNLVDESPEFVTSAYHQLWHVEKSLRMSSTI